MKKLLTGEKNRTKKNTTEKMTTPMPMGRKQKKWMGLYMTLVLIATVGTTTVFAAGDPLSGADGRRRPHHSLPGLSRH